jgi:pantoate--beta-alanine ligase
LLALRQLGLSPIIRMSTKTPDRSISKRPPAHDGASGKPRIVTDGASLRDEVVAVRTAGLTVGLVPTMGALHEGHLSLVGAARAECDLTVVTVFVNPAQFSPEEDFRLYPRDFARDVSLLAARGCDLVFAPREVEIYRPQHATWIDVGSIGQMLEGQFRPTHFRGVATVVMKLFQLAPADRAYFGRKDYQQTLVVKQMVADLNVPIDIRVCPTVREPDGLAMSSRNAYLSAAERKQALALSGSLRLAEQLAGKGERNVAAIREQMQHELARSDDVNVQYIAFVADGTLDHVETIDGPTTVAIAATIGKTRLIDNTLIA